MGTAVTRGGLVVVELLRLAIVVLFLGIGYGFGPAIDDLIQRGDPTSTRLISSVLGALFGYLAGGGIGRLLVRGATVAEAKLERVEAAVLVSAILGAAIFGMLSASLLWPLLFLPGREFTMPTAMIIGLLMAYFGGRLGAGRGGDLLRFVGARGRLEVTSPTRGGLTKIVDTSALMDGRLIEVARAGFLEGTLVVPKFVLAEMQSMADVENPRRRDMARRGLDTLTTLQDEGLVAIEITDEDPPGIVEVDAKLAKMARDRKATLVTVDSNLARVAEISGVRVLNFHGLAQAVRPVVTPGERVRLRITKAGREEAQGVGYLDDGTMVVVERAIDLIGDEIDVDVTSVMQNRHGRMLFAAPADDAS